MKRSSVIAVLSVAVAGFCAVPAQAASFPAKPITIVHGSSPGAPQDVMYRLLAKQMEKVFGEPVEVQGRPGGTSQVAAAYVLGQPANGYTLFAAGDGFETALLLPSAAIKQKSLVPLYRVQLDPFALYVKVGGKFPTLASLVREMRAHPGSVRIGGFGATSGQRVAAENLARMAKVKFTWVPFHSGTNAIAAVLGNNIDAAMSNMGVYRRFQGKAEVIGVSTAHRLAEFPKIPTFKSQGYDLVRYHWRGLYVKAGTPEKVIDALDAGIRKAITSPTYTAYLKRTSTLDGTLTHRKFATFIHDGTQSEIPLLKKLKMMP